MSSTLEAAWKVQIAWCDRAGSPFTARVLEAAWADWEAGGALRTLMPDWPGDPAYDAVPLRVSGALHALALDGSDPNLPALYPPQAIAFDPERGPAAIRAALSRHPARIAEYLRGPPQTNEVGRSGVLLGAFALIAQATSLPLALREIGASAGLNTQWPRYRYELETARWGDPASPVQIDCRWETHPGATVPTLPSQIEVASVAACDVAPVDLEAPGAALRLASYIWADQRARLARLRAAIEVARANHVHVERLDAVAFVARETAAVRPGETTVLYHSVVWQYLPEATQQALRALIADAGARATRAAPFAWVEFELAAGAPIPQLAITLWPGGERVAVADVHPHGVLARWHPVSVGFGRPGSAG